MAKFIPVKNADEVTEDKRQAAEKVEDDNTTKDPEVLINLSSYLERLREIAEDAKSEIEDRFLENLRMRNGIYEPDKLAAMRQMFGPAFVPIYMHIAGMKCRAAESWITETIFQTGKRPFSIEPTPIPELPPSLQAKVKQEAMSALAQKMARESAAAGVQPDMYNVMNTLQNMMPQVNEAVMKKIREVAKENATLMEDKVQDQFVEGGWYTSIQRAVFDFVTFGTMILKGPCLHKSPVRLREYDETSGRWVDTIEERIIPMWERRSPFNIFPSPDATNEEIPWIFDKINLSRRALSDLIGVDGYDEQAIREVLKKYRDFGYQVRTFIDDEKATAEGKDSSTFQNSQNIECWEFHGSIPGSLLQEWGMSTKDIPDKEREYDAIVWMIDDVVIKAMLNPDPLRKKYFYRAGFNDNPDSFWGWGIPDLVKGAQDLANSTARAIAHNVAIASGPQVELNIERLAPGENESLYPWKVWRVTNGMMQEGKAVEFYSPSIVTDKLLEVFNFCMTMADEESGVPRYMQGSDSGPSGAGETASGLNMLMTHAAKGVRSAIRSIDLGVITPSVESCYMYNLEYEKELEIIGDVRFVGKGSQALVAKEQLSLRRNEFLNTTANPIDAPIIGQLGRKKLLTEQIRLLEYDPDEIFGESDGTNFTPPQVPPAEVAPNSAVGGTPKAAAAVTGPDGMPVKGHGTGFSTGTA